MFSYLLAEDKGACQSCCIHDLAPDGLVEVLNEEHGLRHGLQIGLGEAKVLHELVDDPGHGVVGVRLAVVIQGKHKYEAEANNTQDRAQADKQANPADFKQCSL